MFQWFVAIRYLASRFITIAAFLLVSLSVAILVFILAIMEGFRTDMISKIRGTSADLKVDSTRFVGMERHQDVRERVESVAGVRATVPYIDTFVLYKIVTRNGVVGDSTHMRLGVLDLRKEAAVGKLDEYLRNHLRKCSTPGVPGTVRETLSRKWIERDLWTLARQRAPPADADRLRPILVGDEALGSDFRIFREFDPHGLELELTTISPVSNRPRTARFVIAGFFKSKDVEQDSRTVLMDLEDAREFLELENPETGRVRISGLRVFVDPEVEAEEVRGTIASALEKAEIPFIRVHTWREEKAKMLRAVRMEKTLVGIILGVIVIFVGLMIFIIMTVQIVEKSRDLGILQAVGSPPRGIVGIYLRMGAIICVMGIVVGVVVGLLFCHSLNTIERWIFLITGKEVFPSTIYYIDGIPVKPVLTDFLFIIGPTVLVSFGASLLAAVRASRSDPVTALHYE